MPSPSPEALALGQRYRLALAYEPRRGPAGERLGKAMGSSLEFQDRRAYQAGDDVRHLDWRAFARTDQLLVRQYREEVLPRIELLVDASRSMEIEPEKARLTTDLIAVLIGASQNAAFQVTTLPLDERPLRRSFEVVLREGLRFESRLPLEASIRDAEALLRPGSLRILLSDFLSPHDPETLVRSLSRGAGGLVLIQILTPMDAEPPVDVALRLTDSETDEELDLVIDAKTRAGYLARFRRLVRGLETACERTGGLFLSLITDTSLEDACRGELARRGVLEPAG